ncbi:MAG TPA: heparan-alpha-glucosaminide N-acetyltransferase domain-containing protein [Polyangiaceae bacterium]|nr:heparan-alpha-glucosaminide N-acetyltransferase domain-containing protein [Polyangiaceae bacterium]
MLRAASGERSHGVDAFRGLTVIAMIVVHTTRVMPVTAEQRGFRAHASLFEPAVSVAFLWLVGWSLDRSFGRASHSGTAWGRWYAGALLRAATLYALGVLLFTLQYGVVAPDVWASPDVLSTIAWAIVLVGAWLSLGLWGLIGGALAVLALTALLETRGVHVSGLNAGPGATLPLVAVACAGACQGRTGSDRLTSSFLWPALAVVLIALALGLPGKLLDQHSSGQTHIGALWFWNHTLKGILVYGGSVVVGVTAFVRSRLGARRWALPLRLLGRHALVAYVGHLLVLGSIDRWFDPGPGWSSLVSVALGLVAAFTGIAMVLESEVGSHARQGVRRHLGLRI